MSRPRKAPPVKSASVLAEESAIADAAQAAPPALVVALTKAGEIEREYSAGSPAKLASPRIFRHKRRSRNARSDAQ